MADLFDQVADAPNPDVFDQVSAQPASQAPASVQQFRNAVVPGHPIDSIMNGLKAMGMWGGENSGKIVDMAAQGGAPAIGQRLAGPIGGAVGGALGDTVAQIRQLSNNERPNFSLGEMAGSAVAGAVPIKSLQGLGMGSVVKEAGRIAAYNVLSEAAATGIDQGRLPTPEEVAKAASVGGLSVGVAKMIDAGRLARSENIRKGEASFKDETLIKAHGAGLLLDPELSNPTATNKAVVGVAGASQLQKTASAHNQSVVDQLARQEIGVPVGKPLSPIELKARIVDVSKPYGELASLSPAAADAVDSWKDANFRSRNFWKAFNQTGNPEAYDRAVLAESEAQAAHTDMTKIATASGKPGLIRDIDNARIELAKINAVDKAMNPGNGSINSKVLGGMLDAGVPLTGNLETIARFQKAMPQVMGDPTAMSGLRSTLKASTLGASEAVPYFLRKMALSKSYQNPMTLPRYNTNAPDFAANALRFATASGGR